VGAGEDLWDRLQRTKVGYSQDDFHAGLLSWGYEFVREARHGKIYRHPALARHASLDVRMGMAQVLIPKGRQLKEYVARDVLAAIEFLRSLQDEEKGGP
jgi:hypothetical protein